MIDLHVHSTCSDGTLTPKELVEYALTHKITAFALTDHDAVAGLDEAIFYSKEYSGKVSEANPPGAGVEVIPGIELSTEYEGRDIHMVGLFIDYKNKTFTKHLEDFVASRTNRNIKMCSLLREHGIEITYEELERYFPDSVITRAHYAKYMLDKGYVKSRQEAFDRYVGDHAPCYIPRTKVTPVQAIELIHGAGGLAVLAHPTLYHMGTEKLSTLIECLKDAGLDAMEGIYSTYSATETREMQSLARKYNLAVSGGSDFHGANKPGLQFGTGYGKLYIHEEILDRLKDLLAAVSVVR